MRVHVAFLLGVVLAMGCAPGGSDARDTTEILTTVLRRAEEHVQDVNPIIVHPRQLRIGRNGYLLPGVEQDHYEPEPWAALLDAAERAGVEICEVGQYAMCVVDEALPLAGFIALGDVTKGGDTARVSIAATELGGEWGYAVIYYDVQVVRAEGAWIIDQWRGVGSAN